MSTPTWVPYAERKPTREDADENGCVPALLWVERTQKWVIVRLSWDYHATDVFFWVPSQKLPPIPPPPPPKPEPPLWEEGVEALMVDLLVEINAVAPRSIELNNLQRELKKRGLHITRVGKE